MSQETQAQEQLRSEETMQTDATGQPSAEAPAPAHRVWHAPRLTRIEIKRTMNAGGSGDDAALENTPA